MSSPQLQTYENLESAIEAINGLTDVPPEIKEKLIATAKQLYNQSETKPAPTSTPPTSANPVSQSRSG